MNSGSASKKNPTLQVAMMANNKIERTFNQGLQHMQLNSATD
jgi:hypothetical protein